MACVWRALLAAGLMVMAGSVRAEEVVTYHGCTDAAGAPVVSLEDPNLPAVVGSGVEAGRPVIRYNPEALPRLSPEARLFFYAHECARLNLGLPAGGKRELGSARRADCRGLDAMRRSGLIDGDAAVARLQAELDFSAEQWRLLPGPPRRFELAACRQPGLPATPPRPAWNACVRRCADSLRACNHAGGVQGAACRADYERCTSLCEFRFPQ